MRERNGLESAFVTALGPTQIRFDGDSVDVPIARKNDDITLTVGDQVMVARLGSKDGWVIVCVLGATT